MNSFKERIQSASSKAQNELIRQTILTPLKFISPLTSANGVDAICIESGTAVA